MFYSKKKKQKSLTFNNSAIFAASGGVNYCYNWLLDLLNNTSPLAVSQKLCNEKKRHSEARSAEESLKHHSLSLGEGAVVLAKASYKCGEGAYPMKKGGLNNA